VVVNNSFSSKSYNNAGDLNQILRHTQLLYDKGTALLEQHKPKEAIACFEKLLKYRRGEEMVLTDVKLLLEGYGMVNEAGNLYDETRAQWQKPKDTEKQTSLF
jgi:tetratricopeptide (TPR) repeat protein